MFSLAFTTTIHMPIPLSYQLCTFASSINLIDDRCSSPSIRPWCNNKLYPDSSNDRNSSWRRYASNIYMKLYISYNHVSYERSTTLSAQKSKTLVRLCAWWNTALYIPSTNDDRECNLHSKSQAFVNARHSIMYRKHICALSISDMHMRVVICSISLSRRRSCY